jgi:hypothetical protein
VYIHAFPPPIKIKITPQRKKGKKRGARKRTSEI